MRFTYQNGTEPLEGFTILHGIHRGGFGEVYFARSGGGKEVALKLLHDEDHETELRGVTQCLNLKHPNLVNIFDLKTDVHGDHWIVMEYVSGSNLEDVLASFPNGLPLSEVRDWLTGIAAGVAHLHDRGIIHRDLKPANTYRENGVVKVGDVGLSKLLDSESRRRHTQSVGTVYYMAPEVAQGKYGPEVDVYSLGVVLYELITGKLPFVGETTAEILMKHLTAQPNLMPIPHALRPVIAHALEKDPRKRTSSVRQLELEFLRAVQSSAGAYSNDEPLSGASSDAPGHRSDSDQRTLPWSNPLRENGDAERSSSVNQTVGTNRPSVRSDSFLKTASVILLMLSTLLVLLVVLDVTSSAVSMRAAIVVWPKLLFLTLLPFVITFVVYQSQQKQRKFRPVVQVRDSIRAIPETFRPERKSCSNHNSRLSADHNSPELLPELGRSFGIAALVASILSLGLFRLMATHFDTAVFPAPENVVLFTAVSILASWLVLTSHLLTWNSLLSKGQRLLVRIATGALIGTCAFGLQQFLNAHIPLKAYTMPPAVFSDPTWPGYVAFFAGWLLIQRKPREFISDGVNRFSLGLMAKSVLFGFLASLVFSFPQWYAMLWTATISTTIQLASIWSPKSQFGRGR